MYISTNIRSYCVETARNDDGYARKFASGWRPEDADDARKLASIVSSQVWSPIVYKNGRRLIDNFIEATWCALDFDDGQYTIKRACKDWCDTIHVIGLSKSHQIVKKGAPPCDRFRIVFAFEKTITDVRTYNHNSTLLVRSYGADNRAKDAARLFFPCTKIVSICSDGYLQKVHEAPRYIEAKPIKIGAGDARWAQIKLAQEIDNGDWNDTIYRIAKDLYRAGYNTDSILEEVKRNSRLFNKTITPSDLREATSTIRSAVKKVINEQSD